MKILRIVVDKLPEGCYECSLVVVGVRLMCIVDRKEIANEKERPSWCPLVQEQGQLFDG